MVDDELGGLEGVDLFGVAAQRAHGVAHGGEIDDGGHAGEVLHQDPGRHVGDFSGGLGLGVPVGEEADVGGGDGAVVLVAEEVFKQDAEGEGQAGEVYGGLFGESLQAEVGNGLVAAGESGAALEGVGVHTGFSYGWRLGAELGVDTSGESRGG